jgi:hypothetical protein
MYIIMKSNELCKKLNEESYNHATIPDSQRYNVHFEYYDLVRRLEKIRKERENSVKDTQDTILLSPRQVQPKKNFSLSIKKSSSKNTLKTIYIDQPKKKLGEGLPNIKSPRTKLIGKNNSTGNLRDSKFKIDLKLQPIRRNQLFS